MGDERWQLKEESWEDNGLIGDDTSLLNFSECFEISMEMIGVVNSISDRSFVRHRSRFKSDSHQSSEEFVSE